MKQLTCSCSNILSFENSYCLQCNLEVGFDPESGQMQTLGTGSSFRRCDNGISYGTCNWLLPVSSPDALCLACRLNLMIPDLYVPGNDALWARLESAKKRAIYSLLQLQLPVQPKSNDYPQGLGFRFITTVPGEQAITGHEDGVITMNLEEADDVIRERNRVQLHEPYRTLLGHFRHELGHYYWGLWFEHDERREEVLPAYRSLFGDERIDYSQALQRHYQQGAPPDWQQSFVTAYATMHPWEDWAETWAHYLHIVDAVETAHSFHIQVETGDSPTSIYDPASCSLGAPFENVDPHEFLNILNEWIRISPSLNEMASSLGRGMLYPFALPPASARKLHLVHCMIQRQSLRQTMA